MKDLCGEIRNACMSLRLVMRHLERDSPERILMKAQLQRIEDALIRYQVKMVKDYVAAKESRGSRITSDTESDS